MTKIRLSHLLFVFFLCFISFLAGWLSHVFIAPGKTDLQPDFPKEELASVKVPEGQLKQKKGKEATAFPLFESLRDNILFLFDPYKMDSALKQDTRLNKKDSPIKNQQAFSVPLKMPRPQKAGPLSEKKLPKKNLDQNKESLPLKTKNKPLYKTKEEIERLALKKLQEEYDKKNREQLEQIKADQKTFSAEGKFSFLINAFSDPKEAVKSARDMKEQYPLWSFLLKAHKDHIRVYLGPFPSKAKALEFKKSLAFPPAFSLDFLEEVSL